MNRAISGRLSLRLYTAAWCLYWLALCVATHVPVPGVVRLPRFSDKVIHFVLFFGLTALGGFRFRAAGSATARRLLLWAAIYIAYAGLDEWTQGFVGRDGNVPDFVADVLGVASATAMLLLIKGSESLSDVPKPTPKRGRM